MGGGASTRRATETRATKLVENSPVKQRDAKKGIPLVPAERGRSALFFLALGSRFHAASG
jgi:hypothetical protein